jgi:rod shape-determining protein MreD
MLLIQSALLPFIGFLSYAPFIALTCMRTSYLTSLWCAALVGLLSDLLAADPFGITALSLTLTASAAYRFRNRFFQGEPLQLCIFTGIISFFYTPMHVLILFIFDRRAPFSGKWSFLDFFTMPFIDAAYAFFWLVGPLLLFEWGKSQWKHWMIRRNG